jgi:tRNA pseudouridine38-40 synthase
MRYALKVYYDGRDFFGSQRQPGKRTVEGEFLKSLKTLDLGNTNFLAASRTDGGVSSLGNVFALTSESENIKPRVINSILPEDIKVLGVREMDTDFNPRYAVEREYRYFLEDESYDFEALRNASHAFVGVKSFHNFCHLDHRNPVRKINTMEISEREGIIVLTISGESFLWQMVRRIVTALKKVGAGELSTVELERYFDTNVLDSVSPSPSEPLFLWDVRYDFKFNLEKYSTTRLKRNLEKKLSKSRIRTSVFEEVLTEITT